MARPKLRSPGRSPRLRFILGLFGALASLRLAVAVIGASAVVLGWATFVESRYGTEAVHFGIYGAWWFAGLVGLLGLNVLCAAAIRFPWRRHQTGFLITHAGILVLLVGCLLSRMGGIDAQLPVFEGGTGHVAFEDTRHFQLEIHREPAGAPGNRDRQPAAESGAVAGDRSKPESVVIPFTSGPFNWEDYGKTLFWFPWRLAHRDQGVVYDRDEIRLEVLDYYSDSRLAAAGSIKLRAKSRPSGGSSQETVSTEEEWTTVELSVRDVENPHSPHRRMGLGGRRALPGGERIVFWVAGSQAETDAFLNSRPAGPLSELGQLVFHAHGKTFHFPVERFEERARVPLGDTGAEVELVRLDREFLAAVLQVYHQAEPPRSMLLFADFPELNRQDDEHGIFGTYWFDASKEADRPGADPADPESTRNPHLPRIDIVQGADEKLYYRAWNPPELDAIGTVPADGGKVVAFQQTDAPVVFYVEGFMPNDRPGWRIEPVAFAKKPMIPKQPRARLRLTVDGNSEQFWLDGAPVDPFGLPPGEGQRKVVQGNRRRVAVTLRKDEIDVGFTLYLHDFQRKLDPGSSMASHYSSLVDLCDRHDPEKVLQEKVLITLNEPVNFSDPATGRSYRVYQEAFRGPFRPGEVLYDQAVSRSSPADRMQLRDEVFLSWLTVNYDPGRGLKYLGSLLIVAGIAAMFYMKAYFFKPRGGAGRGQPSRRRKSTGPKGGSIPRG